MDASSILSGYGLAGLVIAALASAVVTLYLQNQRLHKDWREWLQKSNEMLEKSNQENRATVDKLVDVSNRLTQEAQGARRRGV